ncbi:HipA domain-containing protein [Chitinimonas sp. BJB300]|uniref:HipA domain-containing protein n=1 Tax=Chitinimonas sp. BJB300 TaxID=1559339 RepID=UPI0027E4D4AA|nr:HipA domain-containing protein [Chitinimonas sp. BJB300]
MYDISGRSLDETDIAELLRNATSTEPLGRHEDGTDYLRLSIAGAQEKTALLRHAGIWMEPHGSTPTTHILKLPMGLVGGMRADMRTSVENEWLCSKIVAAYGLPVANCEIAQFEDQKVLVVERFDRRLSEDKDWIMRLPQEDLCQATGVPPHQKYQADGGPGITQIMDILLGSDDATTDRSNFFKAQLVFWLLSATDGHAKNFSIVHLPQSRYIATPLYDVLSTHPIIGSGPNQLARHKAKLAMGVQSKNLHYLIDKIQRRHWAAQAKHVGLGEREAETTIEMLINTTDQVISTVSEIVPAGFPTGLAETIFEGLRSQRDRLARMPSTIAA